MSSSSAGSKSGTMVVYHNANNDPNNSSIVNYVGYTPSASQTSNFGSSLSGDFSLGNTNAQIQFSNTGSGGVLTVHRVDGPPPPGSFNNPDATGNVFNATGPFWVFSVTGFSGASFSFKFPSPGTNARVATRPENSPPGTPWTLVPLSGTTFSGGLIIVGPLSSFSEWTVVTPGTSAPTLESVSPIKAMPGQRLNVTATGTNFVVGSTFSFGSGVTVNSVEVTNPTLAIVNITVASTATPGTRSVTVTNPTPGGGSATLPTGFTVGNLAPTVSGIVPTSGDRGASLSVIITGTNFEQGVTTVSFGSDITVLSQSVSSATTITASILIPATSPAGTRTVTVTNAPPGGGSASLAGAFTVRNLAPTISAVTPSSGERGKSLTVTVTGTNFESGVTTAVDFGPDITVNSFTVAKATELSVQITISPTATLGARDVKVTNASPGGGTATKAGAFSVVTPTSVETISSAIPETFYLDEIFPNPFNPSVMIRFGVPEQSTVSIQVYDLMGRMVVDLVHQPFAPGSYQTAWNAAGSASGTYLIRMTAQAQGSRSSFSAVRKALLTK